MGKNILIFADGTGNEGGLLPDESRTNVYKLFCATRTGPDSNIDPSKQIAFYVPGVGAPIPEHTSKLRRLYEVAQQAVGLGLRQKIIDCYVAIISVWHPDDRIYLFGFSRGGYTVRCVSHVLELFGIPTKEPGAQSISLDPKRLRKVAGSAVSTPLQIRLDCAEFAKAPKSCQGVSRTARLANRIRCRGNALFYRRMGHGHRNRVGAFSPKTSTTCIFRRGYV